MNAIFLWVILVISCKVILCQETVNIIYPTAYYANDENPSDNNQAKNPTTESSSVASSVSHTTLEHTTTMQNDVDTERPLSLVAPDRSFVIYSSNETRNFDEGKILSGDSKEWTSQLWNLTNSNAYVPTKIIIKKFALGDNGEKIIIGAGKGYAFQGSPVFIVSGRRHTPMKVWMESETNYAFFDLRNSSTQNARKKSLEIALEIDNKNVTTTPATTTISPLKKESLAICFNNSESNYTSDIKEILKTMIAYQLNKEALKGNRDGNYIPELIRAKDIILQEIGSRNDMNGFSVMVKSSDSITDTPLLTKMQLQNVLLPEKDEQHILELPGCFNLSLCKIKITSCDTNKANLPWIYFAAISIVAFLLLFLGISCWQYHNTNKKVPVKEKTKQPQLEMAPSSMINPAFEMDDLDCDEILNSASSTRNNSLATSASSHDAIITPTSHQSRNMNNMFGNHALIRNLALNQSKLFRRGSTAFHRTPSSQSQPDSPPIEEEWLRMNQEMNNDNRSRVTMNADTGPLAVSFQTKDEEMSYDTHV